MSSREDEQRSSQADGKAREQEEENFYDCKDTVEPPDQRGRTEDREKDEEDTDAVEKIQQDKRESGDFLNNTDRLSDISDITSSEGKQREVDKLVEEAQNIRIQEDSDSELKDDKVQEVEFDDDYLREVEKDMTEEEKESRRQQSLALKDKGNSQFKAGNWLEAETSYKEALVFCPVFFSKERAVLFSNRAAARLHLDRNDEAISDCTRAIELNPDYLRALLRRAELYEKTEKLDEALEDYKKVIERDPNQTTARQACMRLPQEIQEKNEKLKDEMLGKLKDLGNMVLRPFGLSTNNFQMNQDPNTGSYSINFVQGPNNNR